MQAIWQITSSAGVDLGTYEGASAADALDAMARDAGYASQADAPAAFDGTVVEVESVPPPRRATLTLGRDGMGDEATEADFDAWTSYVAEHIDERTGLDVTVDQASPRDVQTDAVRAASEDDEQTVREALAALWDSWCADGAPGVEVGVVVVRETHSIGYRCAADLDAAEIDAAVRAQLAPAEIAAWQAACDAGRGPAADADVSGVRWVVTDEDWPSAVTYTITATNGAYLRESMRTATAETVDDVLASAAAYIGAEGEIERQDGGDIVLGPLVARREVQS